MDVNIDFVTQVANCRWSDRDGIAIYGSAAFNALTETSDIDVIVVRAGTGDIQRYWEHCDGRWYSFFVVPEQEFCSDITLGSYGYSIALKVWFGCQEIEGDYFDHFRRIIDRTIAREAARWAIIKGVLNSRCFSAEAFFWLTVLFIIDLIPYSAVIFNRALQRSDWISTKITSTRTACRCLVTDSPAVLENVAGDSYRFREEFERKVFDDQSAIRIGFKALSALAECEAVHNGWRDSSDWRKIIQSRFGHALDFLSIENGVKLRLEEALS